MSHPEPGCSRSSPRRARRRCRSLPSRCASRGAGLVGRHGRRRGGAGRPPAPRRRPEPGPASVLGTDRTAPLTAALSTAPPPTPWTTTTPSTRCPAMLRLRSCRGFSRRRDSERRGGRPLVALLLGVEVMSRVSAVWRPGTTGPAGTRRRRWAGSAPRPRAPAPRSGCHAHRPGDGPRGRPDRRRPRVVREHGEAVPGRPCRGGRAPLRPAAAAASPARPASSTTPAWVRRLSPDWAPARLDDGLGQEWAMNEVFFKRFPCCFATHAALTALLDLAPRPDAGRSRRWTSRCAGPPCWSPTSVSPTPASAESSASRTAPRARSSADTSGRSTSRPRPSAIPRRAPWRAGSASSRRRSRRVASQGRRAARDGSVRERIGDLAGAATRSSCVESSAKFLSLVEPRLGKAEAQRLREALGHMDEIEDLTELTRRARN